MSILSQPNVAGLNRPLRLLLRPILPRELQRRNYEKSDAPGSTQNVLFLQKMRDFLWKSHFFLKGAALSNCQICKQIATPPGVKIWEFYV